MWSPRNSTPVDEDGAFGQGAFGAIWPAKRFVDVVGSPSALVTLLCVRVPGGGIAFRRMTAERMQQFLVANDVVFKTAVPDRPDPSRGTSRGTRSASNLRSARSATGSRSSQSTIQSESDWDSMLYELNGNTQLLTRLGEKMARAGNRVSATVLDNASPFMLEKGRRSFVVGAFTDPDAEGRRLYIPVYRRMQGNALKFYQELGDAVTAEHVLSLIESTLYMLREMKSVGAHHVDIKDENILVSVECPIRSPGARADPLRLGGCHARFALCDYGLVLFNPRELMIGGTPGFMLPLMYPPGPQGRQEFEEDFERISTAPSPTARGVWDSYAAQRRRRTPLSGDALHEKHDLYATGMILLGFDFTDPRARPLHELAARLVSGDPGGLWTVEAALLAYRAVRASMRGRERRIPAPHVNVEEGDSRPLSLKESQALETRSRRSRSRGASATSLPEKQTAAAAWNASRPTLSQP